MGTGPTGIAIKAPAAVKAAKRAAKAILISNLEEAGFGFSLLLIVYRESLKTIICQAKNNKYHGVLLFGYAE
jgi:hypothetical protein